VPGPADNDGCPKPKFIVVTKEKIELKQKVHFATNKSTIYPDSFPMLAEVAEVLTSRPEIKVRIEGHTDSRGTLKHNMTLSDSRAESVRQFLVAHGVEPERMEARGFGPTQPIDDNRTSRGRENNRRSEFIITSQ
jgi:OOP family OmpA-OmpF porin